MTFSGVNTSGTNGAGSIGAVGNGNANSGAPTSTLVTQGNGSFVVGVGNDWDNAIARTPGTGQNLVGQYLAPVGDTYWVRMETSPTALSGTAVTINDIAPTGDRYNLSIVEIMAAAGGGTTGSISGTISPAASSSGATVTLSQNETTVATTMVPASGSTYSFINVASGTYTVTPSEIGFTFSPPSQSVTVSANPVTVPIFTATAASTYTISGSINPAASGSGATVTLSQNGTTVATTTIAASGTTFTFSSLANGAYTVTPSETGFTFNPPNSAVTVSGANVTIPVFTGITTSGGIQLLQKNVNGNEATGSQISAAFPSNNKLVFFDSQRFCGAASQHHNHRTRLGIRIFRRWVQSQIAIKTSPLTSGTCRIARAVQIRSH
jgi:hypothetical protein